MKQFKRNTKTGIVEVWENGKKVGEVITMGDEVKGGGGGGHRDRGDAGRGQRRRNKKGHK